MLRSLLSSIRLYLRLTNEIRVSDGKVCLVHSMGKVASGSVYHTLEEILSFPVYQTHFLSAPGISNAEDFFKDAGSPAAYHIRISRILRRRLPRMTPIIVTLVRDPIAREISDYFQNFLQLDVELVRALRSGVALSARDTRERVLRKMNERIDRLREPRHHVHTWFDNEVKSVFGVDVYAVPFDYEAGFLTATNSRCSIQLLRLEDLDRAFGPAMRSAFGSNVEYELKTANRSRDKRYAGLWRFVVDNLRVPIETCREIYGTRLGTHFYQDMGDELTRKWSRTGL